jgi:phosphoribosylformylglycinamidine synthase
VDAASARLLDAAHDLSDGGLAIAVAESCLGGGTGCRLRLAGDPFVALFSESAARAVVAVRPGADAEFAALCDRHGVAATEIGTVGGDSLEVEDLFTIPLGELREPHEGALPGLFG